MKRCWSLGAVLVLAAGLGLGLEAGVARAQSAAKASSPGIDKFMKIRTPGAPTIGPDGTLYVRDWPDGIWQLFKVEGHEARPDAKMTALTTFKDGLAGYSLSEDGTKALLLHATGGNENTQVSLLDVKSGKTTPLLSNPKVQHAVNLWLRDDSGFVYTANDESANDFYIYRCNFGPVLAATKNLEGVDESKVIDLVKRSGHTTKLLGKSGSWSAQDITTDTSRLLVSEFRSASDSSIYELDAKTGKLTDLTVKPKAEGETVSIESVGYMPGEASILFTSDIDNGLKKLFLKDLKGGQVSKPISELEAFELDSAGMNKEKTLLTAVTNEDGYGVLHVYRLPTFEKVELPTIEKGVVSVNELRGNHLIYSLSNARTPGVAFAYDIPEKGGKAGAPTQVTFADTQGIDFSRFALPQLVKYKSFDGLEVPAFVYMPAGAGKGHPVPFVANYHGGPEGQHRPVFDRNVQYLVSQGFGVILPNVRGSSGYGRAFLMMDDYKKRWDSVKDGVAAAQWLVDQGYATPGKMSTYGGSYGGFMSVACLVEDQQEVDSGAHKQRLFGAGIDVVGIVNMKTFLEQTSGYRRKLREVEYGPLTDPDFLDSVSSIKKVDKINVPMFIAHGFNDPRVPVGEAMQLSIALKEKAVREKKPENMPHLFIAPDEGHGFQKLNNRLYFAEYMAGFLKQTIGKEQKD